MGDDRRTRVARQLGRVPEIGHGKLEEINHNQQKCPPEVASAPKVDEAKKEQVVGDEPWCQVQCGRQGS